MFSTAGLMLITLDEHVERIVLGRIVEALE
jgi:hypothetical protein